MTAKSGLRTVNPRFAALIIVMKTPFAIARCLILVASLAGQSAVAAQDNFLAFTHATLIDGTGSAAQADMTVVIKGNRIAAIGRSAATLPPKGSKTVDATGKFLIPGLWDSHVHWDDEKYLPLFIANGVVGIRMMWGFPKHHEWRERIERGALIGPHLLIASAIVDGPKPVWPDSVTAGNAAEGRKAVQDARREGADFIKVYSLLPREAYFAIADEAKKEGIPFEGHVPSAVSIEEASAAGQKTIEHMLGILPACSTRETEIVKSDQEMVADLLAGREPKDKGDRWHRLGEMALDSYSPAKAAALFALLKSNQTWQCPTFTIMRHVFSAEEPMANDARLQYMPLDLRLEWDSDRNGKFSVSAFGSRIFQKELEIVGAMQRAGVGILAGTDTSNPYCMPGFSLHDELALLVRAGLTPMEALQAATRNPAQFMGREKDLGTIENGKLADVVLLDANPLDDIHNTRKINAVVFAGRLFDKAAIDDMLAKVWALAGSGQPSIAELLLDTIRDQGIKAAIQQYRDLKTSHPAAYNFSESELDTLAGHLLERKKTKAAIQILELNIEAYPKSSNAYDSLAEACLADGDKPRAIECYKKSLQLDPGHQNAIDKLKQLEAR
jgi:cytosine/adenosine deaminase-related metal-dependent hydrolase